MEGGPSVKVADESPPSSDRDNLFLRFVLVVAVLWLIVALTRTVPPNADDLFFVGPAWQLASTGDFTHPWLKVLTPPFLDHGFHLQPPFYSYVLGGWLAAFGLSTQSLLLFHGVCGFLVSLAIGRTFQKLSLPLRHAFLLVLVYVGWSVFQGTRQDILAMVFLSAGILTLAHDSPVRWFWGSLFLGAAVGTSTIQIAYTLPAFSAWAAIHLHKAAAENTLGRRFILLRLVAILLAAGILLLLFLLCIRFQWQSFWHDFKVHAGFRRPPVGIPYYAYWITHQWRWLTDLPVALLFLSAVGLGLAKWRSLSPLQRGLFVALPSALLLNVLIYAPTLMSLNLICCAGLIFVCASGVLPPRAPRLVFPALAALLVLNQSLFWLRTLAVEKPDLEQMQKIREFVARHPERHYAIDHGAARHIFDYQLPPNTLSWEFLNFQPREPMKSMKEKSPDMVWIVSRFNLESNISDSGMQTQKIRFLGRTFNSMSAEPYDFVLIE